MAEYATNPDTSIARGAVNAIGGMGVKVPSPLTMAIVALTMLLLPMAVCLTTATPTTAILTMVLWRQGALVLQLH